LHEQRVKACRKCGEVGNLELGTAEEDRGTAGGNWGGTEENAAEGDSGSAGESAAEENSAQWQEDIDESSPDKEFDG
jgi:hypothetical protein